MCQSQSNTHEIKLAFYHSYNYTRNQTQTSGVPSRQAHTTRDTLKDMTAHIIEHTHNQGRINRNLSEPSTYNRTRTHMITHPNNKSKTHNQTHTCRHTQLNACKEITRSTVRLTSAATWVFDSWVTATFVRLGLKWEITRG